MRVSIAKNFLHNFSIDGLINRLDKTQELC